MPHRLALRSKDNEVSRDSFANDVWQISLPDALATEALAHDLAREFRKGDLITLAGGLGAGKTTFARALIRNLVDDQALEVPSPTFTLMQAYDAGEIPIIHADFYRMSGAYELVELGWDEATSDAITIVEWPDRAAAGLKADRLHIEFHIASSGKERLAVISGVGSFFTRVERLRAIKSLLEGSGWKEAQRIAMTGDASTRAYERLVKSSGETAILMISPRRPDGPPMRRGKPYSAIAKLAESVHAFVAVDQGLRALGYSAPGIIAQDLEAGLLLLEDLGEDVCCVDGKPIPERYTEAIRLLAHLHTSTHQRVLPIDQQHDHSLPAYDLEALLIEVELLAEWYVPHVAGHQISGSARAEFISLWSDALLEIVAGPPTWTLRDYHSPNLLWLEKREGIKRIGLLDFQDAVLGHPAYDVASLLQDARVTVDAELELKLVSLYARERKAFDAGFDVGSFARAYAIMGAHRATKVLGIFARLDRRDGKPQYLQHLPRIEAYLARNLAHPVLSRLKGWYDTHLPVKITATLQTS